MPLNKDDFKLRIGAWILKGTSSVDCDIYLVNHGESWANKGYL